jgi:hypothetical protein
MYCSTRTELIRAARIYFYSSIITIAICLYQILHVSRGDNDIAAIPFPQFAMVDFYDRLDSMGGFGVAGNMTRISGAFNEPNMLAGYLVSLLLLRGLVDLTGHSKSRVRILSAAIAVVLFLLSLLTFSKSGVLSYICGIFVMYAFSGKTDKIDIGMSITMLGAGAAVLTLFPEMVAARFSGSDSGHATYTLNILANLFAKPGFEIFRGAGFGGLEEGSAHTFLLTIAFEIGLVGVMLWAAVMYVPVSVYRRIKSLRLSPNLKYGYASLIASCVAIILGLNLYDYLMYPFVWIIFGFCSAFLRIGRGNLEGAAVG